MKYMVTFHIRPENIKAAIKRFMDGEPSRLAVAWSDLVDQKTVAVVEDAQIAEALR